MNHPIEKLKNLLADEIKSAETSLAQSVHHLATATETGLETLEVRLHDALARVEAKRETAQHAGRRIAEFLDEAKTKLEDWKTDHEIEKLEKQADKREQQAADAIQVAVFALIEAEVAIFEALKARKTAIEVAG
jgi:hypothetical protein